MVISEKLCKMNGGSVKLGNVIDWFNPKLDFGDSVVVYYLLFICTLIFVICRTSTKLNPDDWILNSFLMISGIISIILILQYGIIGKIWNRMMNFTLITCKKEGDE